MFRRFSSMTPAAAATAAGKSLPSSRAPATNAAAAAPHSPSSSSSSSSSLLPSVVSRGCCRAVAVVQRQQQLQQLLQQPVRLLQPPQQPVQQQRRSLSTGGGITSRLFGGAAKKPSTSDLYSLVGYDNAQGFVPFPLPPPLPTPHFTQTATWSDGRPALPTASTSSSSTSSTPSTTKPRPKHTLVLDIDETLINAQGSAPVSEAPSHLIYGSAHSSSSSSQQASPPPPPRGTFSYTYAPRPDLAAFLQEVSELFEVVFWTAGIPGYGAGVVHALEHDILHIDSPSYLYSAKGMADAFDASSSTSKDDSSGPFATLPQRALRMDTVPHHIYLRSEYMQHVMNGLARGYNQRNANNANTNKKPPPCLMNYYLLGRNQCVGASYIKYLPLLGRPLRNTIMIDDNTRSYALTPRQGILIDRFECGLEGARRRGRSDVVGPTDEEAKQEDAHHGHHASVNKDRSLLNLMPMLRAVAAADDATRELDHWRPAKYDTSFDNIPNNNRYMHNRPHEASKLVVGEVTVTRNEKPLPPLDFEYKEA